VLAREASALGTNEVSEWQVKRWREAGQLPTTRRFYGRGRGSGPVEYPPEAATYTAAFADELASHRTYEEACLACFMRGYPSPERALRKSYGDCYRRIRAWVEKQTDSEVAWTTAEGVSAFLSRRSAAIPRLRAAKVRLREAGKPPSTLRDVTTNLIAVFLGVAGLNRDTLTAFGAGGLLEPLGSLGTLATRDELQLDWLNLADLANTSAQASLTEFVEARDACLLLLDVALTFASVANRTHGLQLDFLTQYEHDDFSLALIGIPALIRFRQHISAERFDANLATLRAQLPLMRATQRLVDAVPPELHQLITPEAAALVALPEPTRQQLFAAIRAHLNTHPDDQALFEGAPETPQPED
jgi:hypothetical protein